MSPQRRQPGPREERAVELPRAQPAVRRAHLAGAQEPAAQEGHPHALLDHGGAGGGARAGLAHRQLRAARVPRRQGV